MQSALSYNGNGGGNSDNQMCIFVTAMVPLVAATSAFIRTCESHGFATDEVHDEALAKLVPESFQFLPLGGCCNCNTALGSARKHKDRKLHDFEAEMRKLKNRGWSASRIERWKSEKVRSTARAEDQRQAPLSDELKHWIGLIDELLTSCSVERFGLVFGMDHGLTAKADFPVKRVETIKLSALTSEKLSHLDEDVLYQFVRK